MKFARTRASEVRPARAMPKWLSMGTIFFWYDESSSACLCSRSGLRSKSGWAHHQGSEHAVGLGDDSDHHGALLDGLARIFHLEDAALRGAGLS